MAISSRSRAAPPSKPSSLNQRGHKPTKQKDNTQMKNIPLITLANDGQSPLILDAGIGRNPVGQIVLANESRFDGSFLSEPLTAYSTGWGNSDEAKKLKELLDFMAPEVPVARRFEFKTSTNAEQYLSETDDIRAIGGGFKRVEYKGGNTNEKTLNKGLTVVLDKDEMQAGDEERAVSNLMARLYRNETRRAATILLNVDASGTNKTWGSSANPDNDVLSAIDSAGDSSGMDPNRVLYGRGAWLLRASAAAAQDTAGAIATLMARAPQDLAAFLGVEQVLQTSLRYQSAAATKTKIVGAYVVVFHAQANVGKDDPSCVKRFITPVGSGMRVYRQEYAKYVEISVEHYSNIVATSTVGAKKLNIS